MRKNRLHSLLLAPLALLAFGGCTSSPEYFETYRFADNFWFADSTVEWKLPIQDTLGFFDLAFDLRHEVSYPYANLFLFVEIISPDGARLVDTLNYELCTPAGEWYGHGFGKARNIGLPYRLASRFAQTGEYRVRVRQGMRNDPLPKVMEISFLLYPHENGQE